MKVIEHTLWYKDPRIWVLALAMVLFFFTMIETDQEKKERRTVEVPASTSQTLGSTGGTTAGF